MICGSSGNIPTYRRARLHSNFKELSKWLFFQLVDLCARNFRSLKLGCIDLYEARVDSGAMELLND